MPVNAPGLLNPNDEFISPDERRAITQQNLFSTLAQAGMGLMGAGGNILEPERARLLAGVGQTLGGMGANKEQMLMNAAQQKLAASRYSKDRRQEAADAELMKIGENPAFLDTLKQMPPDLQSIVPALFKSGRARDAVTLVDNWRTNQARESALNARENRPPLGYRATPEGGLTHIPGGPADPSTAGALAQSKRDLKVIPATENDKLSAGGSSLLDIDRIVNDLAVGGNKPSSTAADWLAKMPLAGDKLANIVDPPGAMFRAAIAGVSTSLLKAQSGLAVTMGEYQRMAAKLPDPTESPEIILNKLAGIRRELAQIMAGQSNQYNEKNGFVPHYYNHLWVGGGQDNGSSQKGGASAPPVRVNSPEDARKLKSGTPIILPDGTAGVVP